MTRPYAWGLAGLSREEHLAMYPKTDRQLTLHDVVPAAALVVLHEKPTARTCGLYLRGDTCLNALAALARFVGGDVKIAIYHGHSASKWEGRGLR
jgi:hypothetical protein